MILVKTISFRESFPSLEANYLLLHDNFSVMDPQSFLNGVLKRTFDLIFSSSCLIGLSPMFLIIVMLIKKDSPGPAFFPQERVGKDGKKFLFIAA